VGMAGVYLFILINHSSWDMKLPALFATDETISFFTGWLRWIGHVLYSYFINCSTRLSPTL
jgi:hypothetical protein